MISRWPGVICPVILVEELQKRGGHEGHVPLFGRIRINHGVRKIAGKMSYSRTRELVRGACIAAGLDPKGYGLHSFRSGGASSAAAMGVPERLIRRHGGWRSDAGMTSYLEETLLVLMSVS